jgi:hypothetical protein
MKRTILFLTSALLIVLMLIVARSVLEKRVAANDDQSGSAWEYLVVQGGTVNLSPSDGGSMRKEPGPFNRESFPLEKNLDKLGAKGWELVTISGSPADPVFFFKRRK